MKEKEKGRGVWVHKARTAEKWARGNDPSGQSKGGYGGGKQSGEALENDTLG